MTSDLAVIVRNYLESLGNTPDEVHQTLKDKGIKGRRASASRCPISNAVHQHVKMDTYVTHTDTLVVDPELSPDVNDRNLVVNPWPVAEFIAAFDLRQYPDLDEEAQS